MAEMRRIGDKYGAEKQKEDGLLAFEIITSVLGGGLIGGAGRAIRGLGALLLISPVAYGIANTVDEKGSIASLQFLASAIENVIVAGAGAGAVKDLAKTFSKTTTTKLATTGSENLKRFNLVDNSARICRPK
jgi:hypothetical protein